MKYSLIMTIAILLTGTGLFAQDISFNLASVPEQVKKNASVIKRYENIEFEVTDIDRASYKVHQIITVVSEEGKSALVFQEYTNRYISLEDAEIKVYDANGKQLNRYKKKDMRTVANGDGLIDDGYVTYLAVPASSYPITVEYKYAVKYKGTLFYPNYHILSTGEGVENSQFTVRIPTDLDMRYKENYISLKPGITEEGKYKVYRWSVKNLAPIKYEPGAVSWESRYPSIQLAPNRFSLYGNKGDMSSWESFGSWIKALYDGQDELPEERKAFFRDLVKNAGNKEEKVKLIYEYLQQNFRYVSIQLGIGGYKPFSADFTDKKKYGDCKALSNYMKAALKAVDIKSHVAIINAEYNKEAVDPGFPANRFNHVILCVPGPKDSIWLECTSNTAEFGILGTFTENRNALLITESGGVLVPTPVSKSSNNTFSITTTIDLSEDGSGRTHTAFRSAGRYKELMNYVLNEKKDDQKESIVYSLGFKQPDVFEFADNHSLRLDDVSLNMGIEKIPEFTAGNKMFISPRIYKMWSEKLPGSEDRRLDFFFSYPFRKTDTTIIKLPAGYSSEALPKPRALNCSYATYTTQCWYDETKQAVYSTARLELTKHRIPAADYAQVKKFFDDVLLDDTQRIVIAKK